MLLFTSNKLKPLSIEVFEEKTTNTDIPNNDIMDDEDFNFNFLRSQSRRRVCICGFGRIQRMFPKSNSDFNIEFNIKEKFDKNFYEGLLKGNNIIVAGRQIIKNKNETYFGNIKLTIYDEHDNVIFSERKYSKIDLNQDQQINYIQYRVVKNTTPMKIKLTFDCLRNEKNKGIFLRGYKFSYLN